MLSQQGRVSLALRRAKVDMDGAVVQTEFGPDSSAIDRGMSVVREDERDAGILTTTSFSWVRRARGHRGWPAA
jgi:hypothetical protein